MKNNKCYEIALIMQNHIGKKNAITSTELAESIGGPLSDGNPTIRRLIKATCEQYNLPIVADKYGYYIAETADEIRDYSQNILSRIANMQHNLLIITNNFYRNKK